MPETKEKKAYQTTDYLQDWRGSGVGMVMHASPQSYTEVQGWLKAHNPRAVQRLYGGLCGERLVMDAIGLEGREGSGGPAMG